VNQIEIKKNISLSRIHAREVKVTGHIHASADVPRGMCLRYPLHSRPIWRRSCFASSQLDVRKLPGSCRETNREFSVVQPAVWLPYGLKNRYTWWLSAFRFSLAFNLSENLVTIVNPFWYTTRIKFCWPVLTVGTNNTDFLLLTTPTVRHALCDKIWVPTEGTQLLTVLEIFTCRSCT
jgi:hypothetical protein